MPGSGEHSSEPPAGRASLSVTRLDQLKSLGEIDRFSVLGRIAIGGMSEILLVTPSATDAPREYFVMKRLLRQFAEHEEVRDMFLTEARIGQNLSNENICQVLDYGTHEEIPYMLVEWLDGVPLERVIRKLRDSGYTPLKVALYVTLCVLRGLAHAHQAKDSEGVPLEIIHRDISPHNIMLGFDGRVKLLDFGIAKASTQRHTTRTGVVRGKYSYMAPEQCLGNKLDHRADLFSVGVTIFEMLCGRPPFKRGSWATTMEAVVREPPPDISAEREDVPKKLIDALNCALSKDPEQRFASAQVFLEALERLKEMPASKEGSEYCRELVREHFANEYQSGPVLDFNWMI